MPTDAPNSDSTSSIGSLSRAAMILSLWTLGISNSFYNIMSSSPEFFAARQAQPLDIIILVVGFGFLIPALMAALERICFALNHRFGNLILILFLTILWALGLLPITNNLPLALVLGAVLSAGCWKLEPFRRFIAIGALAAPFMACMFLLQPSIRKQVFSLAGPPTPQVKAKENIVILVLDELPTASLLSSDYTLDQKLFPNFARLAQTSTWYRHASSVADSTLMAVPAILTGTKPVADKLPSVLDHPRNLFTLLDKAYSPTIFESRTSLQPLEQSKRKDWSSHISGLFVDETVLVAHLIAPPSLKPLLPEVRDDFADFGNEGGKLEAFREFLNKLEVKEEPQLLFLHIVLPHKPWIYLPDGKRYADGDANILGLAGYEKWGNEQFVIDQNFQRHLFQTAFVDLILGEFLDKLETLGLFDQCLLIVVGDHGASFEANRSRRFVSKDAYKDLLSVPLFIKMPGQKISEISDLPVQTVDILPYLVDYLDCEPNWDFAGSSFLNKETYRAQSRQVVSYFGEAFEFPAGEDLLQGRVQRKQDLFPSGQGAEGLYKFGPHQELLGSRPKTESSSGNSVQLYAPERFQNHDTESEFCPSWVRGDLTGVEAGLPLAIAVNGVISASSQAFLDTESKKVKFSAFVPPQAFHTGANEIIIYSIKPSGQLIHLGGNDPKDAAQGQ